MWVGREGEREGRPYHVGGGEVVEQVGHAAPAGGSDGDVEDALGARVRFLEGEVADVRAHAVFQDRRVEEVALADVASRPAEQGLEHAGLGVLHQRFLIRCGVPAAGLPVSSERHKVDAVPVEKVQQLVLGVDTHQCSDQRSGPGASDDPRQQTPQIQRLHDPKMAQAKERPALQHERRAPKGLPRIMQQVELRLGREAALVALRRRQRGHVLDRQRDLGDVVLDEQLRARARAIEEPRRGDVAQVAHQARAQQADEPEDVLVLAREDDGL